MKKIYYLASVLSLTLLTSAPFNVGADALEDSFYSEDSFYEDSELTDQSDGEDTFTSEDVGVDVDLFSSQMDEYSNEENSNSADNGWTPLASEPKISFKYDTETTTLSFKASEPVALPDNTQAGNTSNWYNANPDVGNATTVIIGNNITKIGAYNFDNHLNDYPNLKKVILASSVKEIGVSAFNQVSTLQSIKSESIENEENKIVSVERIENNAFCNTGLENITFVQDIISIGLGAFSDCSALTKVEVYGSADIGESAFEKCKKLNYFLCDSTVPTIGKNAFMNCTSLSSFKAASAVDIQNNAFSGCTSLNEFDFSGTETIGQMAFVRTALTKANFNNLKSIGKNTFFRCTTLTSICYYGDEETWNSIAKSAKYPTSAVIHYKADTVEAKDPTCTEPGRKGTNVCDVCGESYSDKDDAESIIPALGHSFSDEYTVDKAATCTEEGEKSKHCSRCDEKTDEQKIDALGHDYVETTVAPTCTEKGTLTKTCSRCNDVVTEEIPALGHEFAKDYTVDVKATCTTDGKQSKHCSRCDEKTDEQKIPAFGHDFTSKVTKEATCTADGVITKTCSRCDTTEAEAIKATGHKFGDWKVVTEATVFVPEQQERICETCGEKETKTVGTALKATATVNASSVKLKVKQSTSGLKVTGLAKGDSVKSWKSTNTKIFTVKGKGNGTCKITAKKAGTAKLQIALASGLKKTVTVKVQKTAVKTTKVTVANTKVTVQKGKKVALKPVVKPFTSKQKVTYTSSNKKVATVSSKGVVTGKKKGTTKITVKSGSKSVKVTVKVK